MRRFCLRVAGIAAAAAMLPAAALAQPYPSKPIRIVVPFVAGGSSDVVARSVAARMQTTIGQNVVVENRPGANGAIAAEYVMRSPPDGYTLMVGSIGTFAINAALQPKLAYDPVKDLEPLTLAVTTPNVLVAGAKFPVSDVKDLVAYARRNPGRLTYASSGAGSSDHLSAELFKLQTATFGVHIPYRGGSAAMSDLMGGNVDVSFQNLGAAMPHITSGRLKALAVTSPARRAQLPDTPTMLEQGIPGFVVTSWQAFRGPRGMPREVIVRLHAELVAALNSPEVRTRFSQLGFDVVAGRPEEYAEFQRKEIERWREVVQKKGLTPE